MAPPAGPIPPELTPSVEEAYRRKCIELKRRLNEVEEGNDVQRQRIARASRGIQKLRLERAFLLEQLGKRTSTNVEDSEGSPSPPPTPKEKPLRTKRGHRKPDFLMSESNDGRPGNTFIQQGPNTLSPSSDAFSLTHPDALRNSTPGAQPLRRQLSTNGAPPPTYSTGNPFSAPTPSRPIKSPFDVYVANAKPAMIARSQEDPSLDVDSALARGWGTLDDDIKDGYAREYERIKQMAQSEKESSIQASRPSVSEQRDEDTEMADDDATPNAGPVGFTAVNQS